jgi:hypothetical protein
MQLDEIYVQKVVRSKICDQYKLMEKRVIVTDISLINSSF